MARFALAAQTKKKEKKEVLPHHAVRLRFRETTRSPPQKTPKHVKILLNPPTKSTPTPLRPVPPRLSCVMVDVLSWALPHWVGNQTGFYSDDTIDYNLKFLECTKEWNIGNIDYIGE